MYKIKSFVLAICVLSVQSASMDRKNAKYFKSDVFRSFQNQWQGHRKSFENAIKLALKENYGFRGMNLYIRRAIDSLRISDGLHITDNIVDLLLLDMSLTSLPQLIMPEVTFALASNVLHVEAGLSKMIIEARYHMYRNQSNILFTSAQDPYKNSPFSYQQVENVGQLAILAEDCVLEGFTLARLSGHTINIGYDRFLVKDCKFSVEISSNRNQGPPVIAPYFSLEQGKKLKVLLARPLREELMLNLQSAIFSYINTSLIFGEYLPKFRMYQEEFFKDTIKDVADIVRKMNDKMVELKEDTAALDSEEVASNYKCHEGICQNNIGIYKVTLHGLDTLYSAHTGGPFKLQLAKIAESLRFHSLLVRGTLRIENNTNKGQHEFVAEIKDMAANVELDLARTVPFFIMTNWRILELSVTELEKDVKNRKIANAFITGYLINKLPDVLKEHLSKIFHRVKGITPKDSSPTNDKPSGVQKMSNINVNCNNYGGGFGGGFGGYVVPAFGYWG